MGSSIKDDIFSLQLIMDGKSATALRFFVTQFENCLNSSSVALAEAGVL
jgi:hypothetical protein